MWLFGCGDTTKTDTSTKKGGFDLFSTFTHPKRPEPGDPAAHEKARVLLQKLEELEQEAEILQVLQKTAETHLADAQAEEIMEQGRITYEARGQLHIEITDGLAPSNSAASSAVAKLTGRSRLRVEVEVIPSRLTGNMRRRITATTMQQAVGQHISWNETLSLPMDEDVEEDARVRIAIAREDGCNMTSFFEPLTHLTNQRVVHRHCTGADGWQLKIGMQWILSRAELLRSHVAEFEVRFKRVEEQIMELYKELEEVVPPEVLRGSSRENSLEGYH